MVTFARNRKFSASASAAPVNQGEIGQSEIGTRGANGPRSECPKKHSLCSYDERII
jgi:hypothetical protein